MERAPPPAHGADPRTAADLLRRHYIALAPELSLREAEGWLNAARARCLPVVEAGRLAGVLAHRALFERYAEALRPVRDAAPRVRRERLEAVRRRPVHELMSAPPCAAAAGTPLAELARLLRRAGTGCVAVLEPSGEGAALLGIVTESDLLRAACDPRYRRRSAFGT